MAIFHPIPRLCHHMVFRTLMMNTLWINRIQSSLYGTPSNHATACILVVTALIVLQNVRWKRKREPTVSVYMSEGALNDWIWGLIFPNNRFHNLLNFGVRFVSLDRWTLLMLWTYVITNLRITYAFQLQEVGMCALFINDFQRSTSPRATVTIVASPHGKHKNDVLTLLIKKINELKKIITFLPSCLN